MEVFYGARGIGSNNRKGCGSVWRRQGTCVRVRLPAPCAEGRLPGGAKGGREMNWLSQSFLWVHAAAAVVWIGGIFFMMAVAVPVAGSAAGALGKRFSGIADWCIAF